MIICMILLLYVENCQVVTFFIDTKVIKMASQKRDNYQFLLIVDIDWAICFLKNLKNLNVNLLIKLSTKVEKYANILFFDEATQVYRFIRVLNSMMTIDRSDF